jgi:hypothetical protein
MTSRGCTYIIKFTQRVGCTTLRFYTDTLMEELQETARDPDQVIQFPPDIKEKLQNTRLES